MELACDVFCATNSSKYEKLFSYSFVNAVIHARFIRIKLFNMLNINYLIHFFYFVVWIIFSILFIFFCA